VSVLHYSTTLIQVTCGVCHIPFAMPQNKYDVCQDRNEAFFCPNGHRLFFTESRLKKAQQELQRVERQKKWAEERADRLRMERDAIERSRAAVKGHLTRTKKRVVNGVCPVPDCKRHFDDLQAHIETCHPTYGEGD
jgi:septal ring factor EnvC (AmiA/AmiB activator)